VKHGSTKTAGIVLAALGLVAAWLLVWGTSAAAAAGYPVPLDRRPVLVEPLSGVAWVVVALVAATLAVTMVLVLRSHLRATVQEVGTLPVRRKRDESRRAA
jgi:hypothetical protein